MKSRQMDEGHPLNSQLESSSKVNSPLHSAWCYVRIEPEAGGAARLSMPVLNTGAIDKGTDARGEIIVRAQRDKNCPHVEGGRRSGNPPTPRAY